MSWVRPVLNRYLALTEKPFLARETDPARLRRSFDRKARLFFHAPFGTRMDWQGLAALRARRVRPRETRKGPVILYFHGGGYVFGSPRSYQPLLGQVVRRTRLTALLPRYRLASEHPFPAAIEDALAAYRALVPDAPGGIVIGGDSAGGGLALALLAEILRLDLPRPLGVFAFSPLTDLTFSGESVDANADSDVVLPATRIADLSQKVLAGADPRNPRISPLFAGFTGAPPVWLTASSTEFLLDDTRRMADRLRAQNVVVTEVIETGLPHVWPLFHNLLPEARGTLDAVAAWINSLSPTEGDN